jgi:FkbM family methyltransferase
VSFKSVEPPFYTWTLVPSDDEIAFRLYNYGTNNPTILGNLKNVLTQKKGGDIEGASWIIEIGANIGANTLKLVDLGYKVVAFEPDDRNSQFLIQNVEQNFKKEFVTICQYAVGDFIGKALLSRTKSSAHNSLQELAPRDYYVRHPEADQVEIQVTKLDEISSLAPGVNSENCALIWIWTQGYEAKVIRGAASLLSNKIPIAVLFYPFLLGLEDTNELTEFFLNNYTRFAILDKRQEDVNFLDISKLSNYVTELQKNEEWSFLFFV